MRDGRRKVKSRIAMQLSEPASADEIGLRFVRPEVVYIGLGRSCASTEMFW